MDFKKKSILTSVVAVIMDDEEKVLLTRRAVEPFYNQWVMPGGKIDLGESLIRALKREVFEEVGIDVHVEGLIDAYESINSGGSARHFIILYYKSKPLSKNMVINNDEVFEAKWVHKSEVFNYSLTNGTRYILEKIFK